MRTGKRWIILIIRTRLASYAWEIRDMLIRALALVISNGKMERNNVCGENRKGEVWHEITGSVKDTVAIDEEGKGRFLVKGGKLAVWVKVKA